MASLCFSLFPSLLGDAFLILTHNLRAFSLNPKNGALL